MCATGLSRGLAQGCADAAERMVTYKDVLIRRSAWMRERSDAREPLRLAAFRAGYVPVPGRQSTRQFHFLWGRTKGDRPPATETPFRLGRLVFAARMPSG